MACGGTSPLSPSSFLSPSSSPIDFAAKSLHSADAAPALSAPALNTAEASGAIFESPIRAMKYGASLLSDPPRAPWTRPRMSGHGVGLRRPVGNASRVAFRPLGRRCAQRRRRRAGRSATAMTSIEVSNAKDAAPG